MENMQIDTNVEESEDFIQKPTTPLSPSRRRGADRETIQQGLCQLGRTADGLNYTYLALDISNANLASIEILEHFQKIQSVNIDNNAISDVTPLKFLRNLVTLRAANNRLLEFCYEPLQLSCLREVDLSSNRITKIDFSNHKFVRSLNLSGNRIQHISGLDDCRLLLELNLSDNRIENIENIDHLPLEVLDLSGNHIELIENLDGLTSLTSLNLGRNRISTLAGLETHDALLSLNVEANEIKSVDDITFHLQDISHLRDLVIRSNPFSDLRKDPDNPSQLLAPWKMILYQLPRIVTLDEEFVTAEAKIDALNAMDPPKESAEYKRRHHLNMSANFSWLSENTDAMMAQMLDEMTDEELESFEHGITQMQAKFRGMKTRKDMKAQEEELAAIKIQAHIKGQQTRRALHRQQEETEAAVMIQSQYRGRQQRVKYQHMKDYY